MMADKKTSILRQEDSRFLSGQGCFLDDVAIARSSFGVFVRSPHAHAEIKQIDISRATRIPGVLAVITGADLAAAGIGSIPSVA